MHWTPLIVILIALAFSVAGQLNPDIDPALLENYFGTPPPEDGDQPPENIGEPPDVDCVCIPFYQCSNGKFNEYGAGILDIRQHGQESDSAQQPNCSVALERCCSAEDRTTGPEPPPVNINGCGIRNTRGIGFEITGAEDGEANFGEFPWMMALMTKEDNSVVFKCGGTLIHPQVVLTTAHYVQNVDVRTLLVRGGEWDTQSKTEQLPYQERDVERVIVHENFYKGDLRNDIALVVLQSAFDPAPHIDVVCLPTQGQNFDGSRCHASGWGKENFGKESFYMNILKSIELPIMPKAQCQRAFRSTRLGQYFKLHSSFICAGGEAGKDTCKGDGGGPLVCPVSGAQERYTLAGLTAWGIGCGDDGIPGAYASVAQFRDWIDNKMADEHFETDSYSIPHN